MSFNPFVSKAVANKAVSLAQQAMQNEAVRKQIKDAPDTVRGWAKSIQQSHAASGGGGALASLARLDPTARYSEPALERRLDGLSENLALVFPDADDPIRQSSRKAIYELRRALIIASPLPLINRKKVYFRIDGEVRALEQALIDAVLPSSDGAGDESGDDAADRSADGSDSDTSDGMADDATDR
ncbi:MAG: hypothetical protein ABIR32_15160 [Ilumatobacteraceae bacterium]